MARAALSSAGAEIRMARSANDALDLLAGWVPDVLVSDIGMPDVDGYTLIRRVRALSSSGRSVPAIALTAYARTEDRVRAISAGFQLHVSKPIDPRELTLAVSGLARPEPPFTPTAPVARAG
jgi:CheY-like chemotaxis protein